MVQLTIKPLPLNNRVGETLWRILHTCSRNSCTQEQLSAEGSEFWSDSQPVADFLQSKRALSCMDCESWAQEGFSWKLSLCKGIEWNSGECPSPFPPELSPWNPFQQPCHGSVWDRPRGEGWGTSSVQWDCQPRTKSIQMISLDNNPTSKDPFRCPQKDNSC